MHDDGLEPLVAAHGLVGRISSSRFPSACQRPLRNSNRAVAWRVLGSDRGKSSKEARIEVDADQGQEPAGLAVAGPEDLVVPVGVLPAEALGGTGLAQGVEEVGFEPLAPLAEQVPGMLGMHILGQNWRTGPRRISQAATTQIASTPAIPDDPTHGRAPGLFRAW